MDANGRPEGDFVSGAVIGLVMGILRFVLKGRYSRTGRPGSSPVRNPANHRQSNRYFSGSSVYTAKLVVWDLLGCLVRPVV